MVATDFPALSRLLSANAQWATDVNKAEPPFFENGTKGQSPKVSLNGNMSSTYLLFISISLGSQISARGGTRIHIQLTPGHCTPPSILISFRFLSLFNFRIPHRI